MLSSSKPKVTFSVGLFQILFYEESVVTCILNFLPYTLWRDKYDITELEVFTAD